MYQAIEAVKQHFRFENHPYFLALQSGSMTKEDFTETQVQFLSAVVFFSRPMACLAARMPRPEQRLALLRNVLDEHGGGSLNFSHESTFLLLLERLGVAREVLTLRPFGPEVRTFNLALWGVCSWDDLWIATACLGMIEDMFSRISAFLGEHLITSGWLHADELIHYTTHARLDVEHAADFYQLLEEPHRQSPEQARRIEDGFRLGAYLFLQLYQGLFDARHRREHCALAEPTSLADGWRLPKVVT